MVRYQEHLTAHTEMLARLIAELNELKRLRERVKQAELSLRPSGRTEATKPRYRAGADGRLCRVVDERLGSARSAFRNEAGQLTSVVVCLDRSTFPRVGLCYGILGELSGTAGGRVALFE